MNLIYMNVKERAVILEGLRKEYPTGAKVELVEMNDPYTKLPKGLKGTVSHVDDAGTIFVNWENGSRLGVAYGHDKVRRIEE